MTTRKPSVPEGSAISTAAWRRLLFPLVAITAQLLVRSGRRVVALDLDFEAPGLSQKLGKLDVLPESGALSGAVDALFGKPCD